MKNEKIGIFDSGLGAMSVLKKVREILPNENYIYYGDSANAPYGLGKTDKDIQILCENVVKFFIKHNCKAIIIASNTATIAALDYLQKKYKDTLIFGIIDSAIDMTVSVAQKNDKKVVVLGTKFTVDSHTYKNLIKNQDEDIEVLEISCNEFASMIEKGWENFDNADTLLENYLNTIPQNYKTLILGCTHYPLILDEIKKYYKNEIVDPALSLAETLKKDLKAKNLLNNSNHQGNVVFYVSGDLDKFVPTAEKFLNEKIEVYKI